MVQVAGVASVRVLCRVSPTSILLLAVSPVNAMLVDSLTLLSDVDAAGIEVVITPEPEPMVALATWKFWKTGKLLTE